ncbi:polyprenyl synthetase family protein [Coleofasciculus sp. E1-EBD-02]|jgi:geranylgeranyl diphosphate synthase type I|uniref:polyprenyl synthetase family protein n=1 Tax=Coleofasciculus sp. E1-EBD-02 TaxID=3068481 RepID=UPI0032F500C7
MDSLKSLYPEIREVFQNSIPNFWTELKVVLAKLFEEPMIPEAILPLASCQAVDGEAKEAIHVCAALLALGLCLRILDDLEDQDRDGQLWKEVGATRAWNYASAIHILSFEILSKASLEPKIFHKINQSYIDAFFRISVGQDRELVGTTRTVEDYWLTVEMKSAGFVATACATGAMVGTDNPELIQSCGVFGHHLGLALQILNDMESIWQPDGITDLKQGKITLPLLYGLESHHSERDELLSLVTDNEIATHAERIKEILDKIDTKSFLIWAALKEREQALEAIKICPNAEGREVLESYITGMFGDIDLLLETPEDDKT